VAELRQRAASRTSSNIVSPRIQEGYRWTVDTAGAVAVRTQYFARPGRRAIVVTDLASLCGPVTGAVELPLRPFWSSPDRTFDLGDPFQRRWLYPTVLPQASPPHTLPPYPATHTPLSPYTPH